MTTTAAEIQDMRRHSGDAFCNRLVDFLQTAGQTRYDESVTQLEHGLQCAHLAETAHHGPGAQVSALLHDIGHLLLDEHDGHSDFLDTDLRHEIVGARLLTRWFGPTIGEPVALHVPAKRYLVATEPDYAATLSEASVHSLRVQGGPMTPVEIAAFQRRPHHHLAVQLRRWDDRGKVAGAPTPPLEHWRPAILSLLAGA
jgi:phosphonate degradation associated HDIG domain protein